MNHHKCAMHFGNNSRWWMIEKRQCFFKLSQSIVFFSSGKLLYMCILIPQSEHIKIYYIDTDEIPGFFFY